MDFGLSNLLPSAMATLAAHLLPYRSLGSGQGKDERPSVAIAPL